jgi:hypothetical protein
MGTLPVIDLEMAIAPGAMSVLRQETPKDSA